MENTTNDNKSKTQYILNEYGEMIEIPIENTVEPENPIKCRVINAFEVFTQVKGTKNYWVSNYGRVLSNYTRKSGYSVAKSSATHYTFFAEDADGIVNRWDIQAPKLIANTFLVKPCDGRNTVYHKDGNSQNNYYKNLIYVRRTDLMKLKKGIITLDELNIQQEYIEYRNKATHYAYKEYYAIMRRCKNDENTPNCYKDAYMCDEWKDNPRSFVKWYLSNYYCVEDERMAVDKDLFSLGDKLYSPDTCCLLPQGVNTYLSNCTKRYYGGEQDKLPLGVYFNKLTNTYYASIMLAGTDRAIDLSEWSTAEEAFEEYKIVKKADLIRVACDYRDLIPDKVFKRLLEYEIKPY